MSGPNHLLTTFISGNTEVWRQFAGGRGDRQQILILGNLIRIKNRHLNSHDCCGQIYRSMNRGHPKNYASGSCFVVFCCGYILADLIRIVQCYFSGTGILDFCLWSNLEEYGQKRTLLNHGLKYGHKRKLKQNRVHIYEIHCVTSKVETKCDLILLILRWNIPAELCQYHSCWCPGSSRRHAISSNGIKCAR